MTVLIDSTYMILLTCNSYDSRSISYFLSDLFSEICSFQSDRFIHGYNEKLSDTETKEVCSEQARKYPNATGVAWRENDKECRVMYGNTLTVYTGYWACFFHGRKYRFILRY